MLRDLSGFATLVYELIQNAEEHINRDHPDLVGKISREDLLGMAEEA